MAAPRFIRLLAFAGSSLLLCSSLAADELDGFTATLSDSQRISSGLNQLAADEIATLDGFIADDLGRARQLRTNSLDGAFTQRLTPGQRERAGLERLQASQTAQLDQLVAYAIASQVVPRDRPRLKDNEVVSLKRRLEVHGGMSFTYGWASGGRNFREASAWVTYYDPKTGFSLGIGLSQGSGDFPYGYFYPYDYGYGYGYGSPWNGYDVSFAQPFFARDSWRSRGGYFRGMPGSSFRHGTFAQRDSL